MGGPSIIRPMPVHRGEPWAFLLSPAQRLLERQRRARLAALTVHLGVTPTPASVEAGIPVSESKPGADRAPRQEP